MSLLQIYLANGLATRGKELEVYQKEISLIEEENKKLKSETASLGGLARLSSLAQEKGFIKNPKVINLSRRLPVALNP